VNISKWELAFKLGIAYYEQVVKGKSPMPTSLIATELAWLLSPLAATGTAI
jgi:hypothetical protein